MAKQQNLIRIFLAWACLLPAFSPISAQRGQTNLTDGWQFSRDSLQWQDVRVPHDWAIYGPFDRKHDLQKVAVEQNGETQATWKTGRSGGLPFIGKGYYVRHIQIDDLSKHYELLFDGAMSNARVRLNGQEVGHWRYGYNAFHVCLDTAVRQGDNVLEVSLDNMEESSRWYPGAGLYRHVRLIETDKVHIPVWGTCVTTPFVSHEKAIVNLRTQMDGAEKGSAFTLITTVRDAEGRVVARDNHVYKAYPGVDYQQNLAVEKPRLWSPETPYLYIATTQVMVDGREVDSYDTRFGIRTVEVRAGEGFYLNGQKRKFRGVCNHHDLGPLGAAVNRDALRHQLVLLKDMGCDAIRTSHNMPASELVELCDEMGLMMMLEPFDDWGFRPKCKNGYGSYFNEWAERDMMNMLHHFRNHASVVMWSVGNEVPSQWGPDGLAELKFLQDIVHREDPTRPVTCGMDQFDAVTTNGFAAALDVAGFNYKPDRYSIAFPSLPQNLLLGSESASTVSSRGIYYFSPTPNTLPTGSNVKHPDKQSNSYDTEYCYWSNLPEYDFFADDQLDYCMGQFVWTGFDYLGEPTPYDTDAWPSHSSYFGIIDLASLPKDRYYLYRSQWNKKEHTVHLLPHWTWPDRKGKITPVVVYTDGHSAELFLNGKSLGRRAKAGLNTGRLAPKGEETDQLLMACYRLIWDDVVYEPGELKVVAYDQAGNQIGEDIVRTAGKPHHLVLTLGSEKPDISSFGPDNLVYVTVQVADKDGNLCPTDTRQINIQVSGDARFRATANGDATCLLPFHEPKMNLFSGAATVILQGVPTPKGQGATLTVTAKGLKPATLQL